MKTSVRTLLRPVKRAFRVLPFTSGIYHNSPPYTTGSVLENRMGLQIVRVLGRNILHKLRQKPVASQNRAYHDALEKDGIVVIENFLSPEQWHDVKAEYEALKPKMQFKPYKPIDNYSMTVFSHFVNDHKENFPKTLKHLGENKLIRELASTVIRRDIRNDIPTISFLILKKDNKADVDDDIENVLHADVHYPTVKCFLYLEDVTMENGPYVYAKGNHKITWPRIKFEYITSILRTRLTRGDKSFRPEQVDMKAGQLRNIISDKQRKEMGVKESYITGKANTLILSNNLGFHRRGEFKPNTIRELILVNFRLFETSNFRKFVNG
ncbi:MAG: phytanoyl-CoA dioxygenase family protein [Bacteroidota bacterium]|nr:phytanoyl-CoA dioxygenase family protein [Bacteroidota bacterium]